MNNTVVQRWKLETDGRRKRMKSECPLIDKNEICWQTGNYQDGCICEFCQHKDECSASGQEDDE